MVELKPCPFCGGEAEYVHLRHRDGVSHGYVRCKKCRIGLLKVKEKSQSIKDWNGGAEDG